MIIKLKKMILENFMYYMTVMLDFPQIAKFGKERQGKVVDCQCLYVVLV